MFPRRFCPTIPGGSKLLSVCACVLTIYHYPERKCLLGNLYNNTGTWNEMCSQNNNIYFICVLYIVPEVELHTEQWSFSQQVHNLL